MASNGQIVPYREQPTQRLFFCETRLDKQAVRGLRITAIALGVIACVIGLLMCTGTIQALHSYNSLLGNGLAVLGGVLVVAAILDEKLSQSTQSAKKNSLINEIKLLDATIPENARKILNIQEGQELSADLIQQNYQSLNQHLEQSRGRLAARGATGFADTYQARIENANQARDTLLRQLSQ